MKKVKRSKRHMTRGDIEMVNEEVSTNMKDEDVKQAVDYTDRFNKLRGDSGNIDFADTLTTFFYLIMRDYLPAGKVEKLVNEVVNDPEVCLFTNGFLAQYADNLSNYMRNAKTNALEKALESAFTGPGADKLPKEQTKVSGELNDVELEELSSHLEDEGLLDDWLEEHAKKAIDKAEGVTERLTEMEDWDEDIYRSEKDEEKEWLLAAGEKEKIDEGLVEEITEDLKNIRPALGTVDAQDNSMVDAAEELKREHDFTGEMSEDDKLKLSEANAKAKGSLDKHKKSQHKADLISSLDALDNLKKLIPTDAIEQIANILKSEVKSELSDEAVEEIETRESILEKRAKENAEHKSSEAGAEEKAVEYIKEVAEQAVEKGMEDITKENEQMSRGNLKDVSHGRAFPEALGNVFEEPKKPVEKSLDERLEEEGIFRSNYTNKKLKELDDKRSSISQRMEK